MTAFIDVNIFMYTVGRDHPYKTPCRLFLERVVTGNMEVATDSESLQEMLYRYWHLGLPDQGQTLVNRVIEIIPVIFSVNKEDVRLAADLLTQAKKIEPRDAVHAAVMFSRGISEIYSYDRHFDSISGITRIEP